MPDDDKIAGIMQEAGRYAARAMEYLPPGTTEKQEDAAKASREHEKIVDGLKVHFLFPNLTDRERAFLVELLGARHGLHGAMKVDKDGMSIADLERHDAANADFQSRYVNARTELALLNTAAKMTELQRRILEQEFLSLPLSPAPGDARTDVESEAG